MSISLSFLLLVVLVLFPGLIFRKLFFYGEFSKEFQSNRNLIALLAISSVPGLSILYLSFEAYTWIFMPIDIGEIVDKVKDISNPSHRFGESDDTPINDLLDFGVTPFLGFLYLSSVLLGAFSGRVVRILRLDIRLKLLRFSNSWFYLFSGEHLAFKKLRHLNEPNKRHVFTNADVLIESNQEDVLYSGILVDYEIDTKDCTRLDKVVLENAKRYKTVEGRRVLTEIPGTLFIVDCRRMKNINLTYVFEQKEGVLNSEVPNRTFTLLGVLMLVVIPFFIFRIDGLEIEAYQTYFSLSWYVKLLYYLLFIQLISLFNPFAKIDGVYSWVTGKMIFLRLFWIAVFGILIYIFA